MRNLSIDVLKIILAFFVVFLHLHFLRDAYPSVSYVLVNGLFRIGVPIFLVITGYYFYNVNTSEKLKKWLIRTFLLYTIWSIIYMPFWEKDKILITILFGYHHLWYLIGTFFGGILLFMVRQQSTLVLSISIVLLFSMGYCFQLLGNFHYFKNELDSLFNIFPFYRNFLFDCFPFLTIGFLLNKLKIETKYKPPLSLVVASVSLVILEAFFNYKILKVSKKENVDLLISLLITCPLVFIYCRNIYISTNSKILSSISTAIYLVHPLLMKWIFDFNISLFEETILFIVVLLVTSIILVFINRKVKYLL